MAEAERGGEAEMLLAGCRGRGSSLGGVAGAAGLARASGEGAKGEALRVRGSVRNQEVIDGTRAFWERG